MDVSGSSNTEILLATFFIGFIIISEFQFMSKVTLRSSHFPKGSMGFRTRGQDGIPLCSRISSWGKLACRDMALQPPRNERERDVHNQHACGLDANGSYF